MSDFYAKMPEDFKSAVEVIKRYCQNEACDYKCSQCPFSLADIRCRDGDMGIEVKKTIEGFV